VNIYEEYRDRYEAPTFIALEVLDKKVDENARPIYAAKTDK
jgi:hypothetical protein